MNEWMTLLFYPLLQSMLIVPSAAKLWFCVFRTMKRKWENAQEKEQEKKKMCLLECWLRKATEMSHCGRWAGQKGPVTWLQEGQDLLPDWWLATKSELKHLFNFVEQVSLLLCPGPSMKGVVYGQISFVNLTLWKLTLKIPRCFRGECIKRKKKKIMRAEKALLEKS